MANVSIEINNREFLIACSDGDEEKVRMLGKRFSERVMNIKGSTAPLSYRNSPAQMAFARPAAAEAPGPAPMQ